MDGNELRKFFGIVPARGADLFTETLDEIDRLLHRSLRPLLAELYDSAAVSGFGEICEAPPSALGELLHDAVQPAREPDQKSLIFEVFVLGRQYTIRRVNSWISAPFPTSGLASYVDGIVHPCFDMLGSHTTRHSLLDEEQRQAFLEQIVNDVRDAIFVSWSSLPDVPDWPTLCEVVKHEIISQRDRVTERTVLNLILDVFLHGREHPGVVSYFETLQRHAYQAVHSAVLCRFKACRDEFLAALDVGLLDASVEAAVATIAEQVPVVHYETSSAPVSYAAAPPASAPLENATLTAGAFERWLEFVGHLRILLDWDAAGTILPAIRHDLKNLYDDSIRDNSHVVFCGRFSAGKSSIINCAAGRDFMPEARISETGACCVISGGTSDGLIAQYLDGTQERFPLSTENIRRLTSLNFQGVGRNTELESIAKVFVQLANHRYGSGFLIDSPGIDSGAETAISQKAMQEADLVYWVTPAVGAFGTSESDALRDYLCTRGPRSVAIIVNVFLNHIVRDGDPHETWSQYLQEHAPELKERLENQITEMGLPFAWAPDVIFISAVQALAHPEHFGGPELRHALDEFASAESRAILDIRLTRIEQELANAEAIVAQVAVREAQLNEQVKSERQAYNEAAAEDRNRYAGDVGLILVDVLRSMATCVSTEMQLLAGSITEATLTSGDVYQRQLNAVVNSYLDTVFDATVERIHHAGRVSHWRWNCEPDAATLVSAWRPAVPSLQISCDAVDEDAGLGAAAATALAVTALTWWLGPVAVLAGRAAASVTKAAAKRNAVASAQRAQVEATQAAIINAHNAVIDQVEALSGVACQAVLSQCEYLRQPPPPPDESVLRSAEDFMHRVAALRPAAARLRSEIFL